MYIHIEDLKQLIVSQDRSKRNKLTNQRPQTVKNWSGWDFFRGSNHLLKETLFKYPEPDIHILLPYSPIIPCLIIGFLVMCWNFPKFMLKNSKNVWKARWLSDCFSGECYMKIHQTMEPSRGRKKKIIFNSVSLSQLSLNPLNSSIFSDNKQQKIRNLPFWWSVNISNIECFLVHNYYFRLNGQHLRF